MVVLVQWRIFSVALQMESSVTAVHQRLHQHCERAIDDVTITSDMALMTQYHSADPALPHLLSGMCPETVHEGTVGAYLYGCVASACSPACTQALPGLHECDIPAYVKDDSGLSRLNDSSGTMAHIYLQAGSTLNDSDRGVLMQQGVLTVQLHVQIATTINYAASEIQPLSTAIQSQPLNPNVTQGKPGYAWVWMLLVMITLIIITVWLLR